MQIIKKYFEAWSISSLTSHQSACYVATVDNKIVATSVANKLDNIEEFFPEGQKHLSASFEAYKNIGEMSVCAVLENYKKQGIGMSLTSSRLKWLEEKECKLILAAAVVYPDKSVPAHNQLFSHGFKC